LDCLFRGVDFGLKIPLGGGKLGPEVRGVAVPAASTRAVLALLSLLSPSYFSGDDGFSTIGKEVVLSLIHLILI